ncbi:hypothetical protein [Sphingomonas morindae]|uniref:Glycine zipper domain-containing protein n=1 Tax=Sphingomonas morindae TaxID=1541170 RepID=A0ABY4XA83_9SPHN|nr:hypothetical protein [Sphingomonas morindae]USI73839.1 hypothetical protein LHA26_05060 [Sphingomonas morindae]
MASPSRSSRGGGVLIALGAVLGALIGTFSGQPSIGVVAGTGLGVALAVLLWWRDRR